MIVNIISCECLDYTPEISFEVCESTEVYNADGSFNRLRIIDKDFDNKLNSDRLVEQANRELVSYNTRPFNLFNSYNY